MKRFFSILSLLTALAVTPQASQLSTLAASMPVGTWAELTTSRLSQMRPRAVLARRGMKG